MMQGKGFSFRKKNIWWHLLPVIKAISCLLCDIIRTQYERRAAFRIRPLIQEMLSAKKNGRTNASGKPMALQHLSAHVCLQGIARRESLVGTLGPIPLHHKHAVKTFPFPSKCFPTPKATEWLSVRNLNLMM